MTSEIKGPDDQNRLLVERACERLIIAYSHLIDLGQAEKAADLFTSDGVWESARRRWVGQERIRRGFANRQRLSRRSRHICTNIAVEPISTIEATGVTYFVLYRYDNPLGAGTMTVNSTVPLSGEKMIGEYRDRFTLVAGEWRFSHRVVLTAFWRKGRSRRPTARPAPTDSKSSPRRRRARPSTLVPNYHS